MHPYLKYLLEDIEKAKRPLNDDKDYSYKEDGFAGTFEEEMEEVERWLSGEGNRPLSYYTQLKIEDFPPAEQLSN